MFFKGRKLKPFAESINPNDLIEGEVYYSLTFVDDEMHIPTMETLIFAEKGLGKNKKVKLYFQDIHSYRQGVRFKTATKKDHAIFFECSEDQLGAIYEFEKALNGLLWCSLRRRGLDKE